ncbi:MAG: DUF4956 domain-containing protein [Oscillospiraceae bacterium]|jgi:hypothetical protein|nr:DUF4956 domain-containing protein [Oscillospiraceae bacterium]
MIESLFGSSLGESSFTLGGLLLSLGVAIGLGLLTSGVYIFTHKTKGPSQGFALTLVILPAVITVIIMLIGNSVARAFSLAGAFQIIRFRSAPGGPKDIAYILFSMAIGLCCGMGFLLYGAVAGVILCGVMLLLEFARFGQLRGEHLTLKITVPEDLDYRHAFDEILKEYTKSAVRRKIKLTDLGSLYEIHYAVTAKPDIDEKAFLDALRTRNGNLNITLALQGEEEF